MKYLIGQLVRAERMGEDSNYLQVEGAVTGHKNGFTLIKAICVRDRYSKEWSMHPTSCACAAKDKDITQIERLSFNDPSLPDSRITAILLAFDVEAAEAHVQPWIRDFVHEFIGDHQIRGLCDPMYVANCVAHKLAVGDGSTHFFNSLPVNTDEDAVGKLARQLSFAYQSCGANEAQILEKLQVLVDEANWLNSDLKEKLFSLSEAQAHYFDGLFSDAVLGLKEYHHQLSDPATVEEVRSTCSKLELSSRPEAEHADYTLIRDHIEKTIGVMPTNGPSQFME